MVAVDSVGGLLASDANKVDFKSTFVQEKVSVAQKKQAIAGRELHAQGIVLLRL